LAKKKNRASSYGSQRPCADFWPDFITCGISEVVCRLFETWAVSWVGYTKRDWEGLMRVIYESDAFSDLGLHGT